MVNKLWYKLYKITLQKIFVKMTACSYMVRQWTCLLQSEALCWASPFLELTSTLIFIHHFSAHLTALKQQDCGRAFLSAALSSLIMWCKRPSNILTPKHNVAIWRHGFAYRCGRLYFSCNCSVVNDNCRSHCWTTTVTHLSWEYSHWDRILGNLSVLWQCPNNAIEEKTQKNLLSLLTVWLREEAHRQTMK